jgi:hypothetical protein
MTPIQCLKKQLDVWESAKGHADRDYRHGTISEAQWKGYLHNLIPLINQYKSAILILQKNNIK